jgi:hypothetical protein
MSTENAIKPNTKATLKRKVGYVEEEASVTRTKFAQMEITEESENGGSSTGSAASIPFVPPS